MSGTLLLESQAVYRIYRELELNLRIEPRKRLVRLKPDPLAVPEAINQVWSMDFMHDKLEDGRNLRLFNVIDDQNRGGLLAAFRKGNPGLENHLLARQTAGDSLPTVPRTSAAPSRTGPRNGAFGLNTTASNPTYVERFNRTVRYEWLSQYYWSSIEEVQDFATQWMWSYNHNRPHMALGGFTPKL